MRQTLSRKDHDTARPTLEIATTFSVSREHTRDDQPGEGKHMHKYIVHSGEYTGQSFEGKRQGKGSYKWANGQIYQGSWREDMRNGTGTETWLDGRKYHGGWKEDKFDGEGVFTWADGTVFKGFFQKYCPLHGEMFFPGGEVYAVEYDGTEEVWDGTKPSPTVSTALLDENIIQTRVDKMYEALCSSSVFADPKSQSTPFIREHAIKQELNKIAGKDGLSIDEIYIEEGEDGEELKVSFDVRRLSTEMTRPMTADGQPGRAQEKDFAFGKSKGAFGKGLGMGRVSMDANRGSKVYDDAVARRNAGSQPRAVTAEDITEEIKPERLKKSSLDMARSTSPSEGADALESDARIKMLIEDLQREKDGGAAGGERRRSGENRRKSGEISRGTSQDGMRRSQDLGGKRSSQDGKRGSQDGKPAPFKRGNSIAMGPAKIEMAKGVGLVSVNIKKISA